MNRLFSGTRTDLLIHTDPNRLTDHMVGQPARFGRLKKSTWNCRPWQFEPNFFVDSNCWSWQFFDWFLTLLGFCSSNCWPWRSVAAFHHCDLQLPTLAVWWPVFSTSGSFGSQINNPSSFMASFSPYQQWPWHLRPLQFHGQLFYQKISSNETTDLDANLGTAVTVICPWKISWIPA